MSKMTPGIEDGYVCIPIASITVKYTIDHEFGPIDASIEGVEIGANVPKKIRKELESKLTWLLIDHEINFNDPDWEHTVEELLVEETGIRADLISYSAV